MKTWIASWKPYFSLYRLKAMQETQYRAAALGGLVTQAFFGLLYVFLYTALFRGENQAELAETITYVWLQQMFFRVLLMKVMMALMPRLSIVCIRIAPEMPAIAHRFITPMSSDTNACISASRLSGGCIRHAVGSRNCSAIIGTSRISAFTCRCAMFRTNAKRY